MSAGRIGFRFSPGAGYGELPLAAVHDEVVQRRLELLDGRVLLARLDDEAPDAGRGNRSRCRNVALLGNNQRSAQNGQPHSCQGGSSLFAGRRLWSRRRTLLSFARQPSPQFVAGRLIAYDCCVEVSGPRVAPLTGRASYAACTSGSS